MGTLVKFCLFINGRDWVSVSTRKKKNTGKIRYTCKFANTKKESKGEGREKKEKKQQRFKKSSVCT